MAASAELEKVAREVATATPLARVRIRTVVRQIT
jgi:hypothetical protein